MVKYKLETIPIWDALEKDTECLFCFLMEKAEQNSLAYYLGSSVMNPETRVQANEIGFCPKHSAMLTEHGKPNSLAVLYSTILETTISRVDNILVDIENGKKVKKSIVKFESEIEERDKGCLICNKMSKLLDRYLATVAILWKTDEEFRKKLSNSKGFCLHHFSLLLKMGNKVLDSKTSKEFSIAVSSLQRKNLKRIQEDLGYMIGKYKAENVDKPWNGCENAHKRAVFKQIGKSRIMVKNTK